MTEFIASEGRCPEWVERCKEHINRYAGDPGLWPVCLNCAFEAIAAALRERDAAWTKALHGLDVCGHPMFRYQGDDPTPIFAPKSSICTWCAPLRALLEEAGK